MELDVVWFLSYLHALGLGSATIHTYLSAINHMNRFYGRPPLIDNYLIRKTLNGIDNLSIVKPLRSPVTPQILHRMIINMSSIIDDPYSCLLYKALFSSMFFMCARVGELAVSQGNSQHVLKLSDLQWIDSGLSSEHLLVNFKSFKHNRSLKVHSIPVYRTNRSICTVSLLRQFLDFRGSKPGPIFVSQSGSPLSAAQVTRVLNNTLRYLGLDSEIFGTHSFRIGRCSDLASQGASYAKIRFLGRFHSDAFIKYIRPQVFAR